MSSIRSAFASVILTCMKNNEFIFPLRVYYEDTDAGGVVYHSNYLNFMERARTELLRELGYHQDVLNRELGVLFVVRSMQLEYLKAARFNEMLQVITSVSKLARASVIFQQDIWRNDQQTQTNSDHITSALVKVACVDAQGFKPKAIPLPIKGALSSEN